MSTDRTSKGEMLGHRGVCRMVAVVAVCLASLAYAVVPAAVAGSAGSTGPNGTTPPPTGPFHNGSPPPPGPAVNVVARTGAPWTDPGGTATVVAVVSNTGRTATASGPVTLTATAPSGFTYASADSLGSVVGAPVGSSTDTVPFSVDGSGAPDIPQAGSDTSWQCQAGPRSAVAHCTLVGNGGQAVPLGAETTSALVLAFNVAPAVPASAHGVGASFTVSVSTPGDTDPAGKRATASLRVVTGMPSPAILPDVNANASIEPGQTGTEVVQAVNVGSGEAEPSTTAPPTSPGGGYRPAVVVSDLVPQGLVGSWQASGPGWDCSLGSLPARSCGYTQPLPVGSTTPPLTVTYSLDQAVTSALDRKPGGTAGRRQWSMAISANGVPGSRTIHSTVAQQLALTPPPGSALTVGALAANGADQLLPGQGTLVDVTVDNNGLDATSGPLTVAGTVPDRLRFVGGTALGTPGAWQCAGTGSSFSCTAVHTSVPAGGSVQLALDLGARTGAGPGEATIPLTATAGNVLAGLPVASTKVALFVLAGDVGIPTVSLRRAVGRGPLQPATDGSTAQLLAGGTFTEQLDVRNAGGAAIAGGTTLRLSQKLSRGVSVQGIDAPNSWRCGRPSGTPPVLRCTAALTQAVGPGRTTSGPIVTLKATRPNGGNGNWAATVTLASKGAPRPAPTAVLVGVTARHPDLYPRLVTVAEPTAGGTGRWRIWVRNRGTGPSAHRVRLRVQLPAGVSKVALGTSRWSCTATQPDGSGTALTCTSAGRPPAGHYLVPIDLTLEFDRGLGGKGASIAATATDGGARPGRTATARLQIEVRPALHAVISSPGSTVLLDQPLVTPNEQPQLTDVNLSGSGSGGSGLGLTYRWSQLCTTAASAANHRQCRGRTTPAVHWLGLSAGESRPSTGDATFTPPTVSKVTPVVIQLAVDDGSARTTTTTTVDVVPPTPADKGLRLDGGTRPVQAPAPRAATLPLPDPDVPLAKATRSSDSGTPPAETAAPAPRSTGTGAQLADDQVTTTTAEPPASTAEPGSMTTTTEPETTTTTPSVVQQAAGLFCDLVKNAVGAKGRSFGTTLPGGIAIHLSDVRLNTEKCGKDTTVSFADSSVTLSSFLGATGVSGTIGYEGIRLTSGTITGPKAWRSPAFTVTGGDDEGIFLAFPGTKGSSSVSATGTVTGDTFSFLPLPTGWKGSTTLTLSLGTETNDVTVDAEATAPSSDASPDSRAPTATITGTVSSDGTFSLAASARRLVQVQGHAIDVSGTVSRATADGPVRATITGSLAKPFDVVRGLSVSSLSVTWAPTDTSAGITGTGQLALGAGSSDAAVGVDLSYDDPANWSLTADGSGSATWQPLPGLTVTPSDFHGAVTAKDGKYAFSLSVEPTAPWQAATGVTLSGIKLALSNVCNEGGGGRCPPGASVYLQLGADGTFTVPVVGTIESRVEGALALPSGTFSVSASVPGDVALAAGFTLSNAKIEITRGLPAPEGSASFGGDGTAGALSVNLAGTATLPVVGKLPAVNVSWSSQGVSAWSLLGGYSLPGAGSGGSSSKLTDTVVGWSSFPTTLNVVNPVTKILSKVSIPKDAFTVSGAFDTPGWFKDLLKLPGDVVGRATGQVNLSNGNFALRMSLQTPGDWYLYGSKQSSANARLASAYFNIERSSNDFSVALGGAALLSVAGSGSLSASSVDLEVALGFSTAKQTIAGSLDLSSSNGWSNAFGLSGLTVHGLAVQFGLDLKTLTPSLGIGADATLPPSVRQPLGMPNGTRTKVVANISVSNPCFGLEVTNPSSPGTNVLDLDNKGVLTARTFDVQIAPTGCTVGQFIYQPGLTLRFDGRILGLDVAIGARIGLSPFSAEASLRLGQITVGGATIDKTQIELVVSPTSFSFKFDGGMDVLGARVTAKGGITVNKDQQILDLNGSLTNLSLGGVVTVKQATVAINITLGNKPAARFGVAGDIDLMGSTVSAEIHLSLDNGELIDARADVKAKIVIGGTGGVVLDGTFKLDYGRSRPLAVDASVAVSVAGYAIANATAQVRPSSFTLKGGFSVAGILSAKVEGAFYWGTVPKGATITASDGKKVAAKAGDFLLSAKDVTLDLGGIKATGSVSVGRASGNTWAALDTTVRLVGTGNDNSVTVTGSISGNGDFSLKGLGNLDLLGTKVAIAADISRKSAANTLTISASGKLDVVGVSVSIAGDFAYMNGSTYFRLAGSASLKPGGFNLGNAAFTISNFPKDAGLYASVDLKAGNVVSLTGRLTITAGSRFYLGVKADLKIPGFPISAEVTFTNCTDVTCKTGRDTYLRAAAQVGRDGFSFGVTVEISSSGGFRATASAPAKGKFSGDTGSLYLAVIAFYAKVSYAMALTISSSSPYVEVKGEGSVDIYGKSVHCWLFGCAWGGWGHIIGISASFQTNPFKACGYLRVWGSQFGGCIGG